MSEEINIALTVLAVGMITVFIILGLVVLTGDVLIRIVNRFFPETAIKSPLNTPSNLAPTNLQPKTNKSTLAAIVAAVDIVTGGTGKADKIEKVD